MTRSAEATQTRILDAAELLFAEHSLYAVSLRKITARAGANLAAVNYHFGDKTVLYRDVMLRRIRPLNAQRLSLLEDACAQAGEVPPPLDKIVLILARPLFELHQSSGGGRAFVHLLARGLSEPSELSSHIFREEYHPVLSRFGQQIRRHATQLSPDEFMWRFSFVVGAMHHTLATLHQMNALTRGICRDNDHDRALARFVAHGVATFRASQAQYFTSS